MVQKLRKSNALLLIATLLLPLLARADVLPFRSTTLPVIEKSNVGEPFLVALWSLDCRVCLQELPLLLQVAKQYPDVEVVLIATDPYADKDALAATLRDFRLGDLASYAFAETPERLRYQIDPGWHGELPRTYFYRPDGSRQSKSGKLTAADLHQWLAQEKLGTP